MADAEALAEALGRIGEPGAVGLAEVFDGRTAQRQAATITARANLETQLREVRDQLTGQREQRDAIAAERDDAPPASDLRPASREGRPGAPLWRLVRFADGTAGAEAAAVEGALYGAGLLTAWVHPDPALTEAALAVAEADGYLVPSVPGSGRTLADLLVPEQQEHVPEPVITAVLRSIALTSDIAEVTGRGGPGRPELPELAGAAGAAGVRVAVRAGYLRGRQRGPGGQHERAVQLRAAGRCPAEGSTGIYRCDQPGRPPPCPARRMRRADRADRGGAGTAGGPAGPGSRAAGGLPPGPAGTAGYPAGRQVSQRGQHALGAAGQDPGGGHGRPDGSGRRDRRG